MERILEGNLDRFGLPDLLSFLQMARLTAALVLERPGQESKVFLRDGQPVFATSTHDALRLGAMLVRQGKVRPEQVEAAIQRARSAGFRIGQGLMQAGLVDEADLQRLLKVQVSEVIFELFEWREGIFTVYDQVPPPSTAVQLEVDLQNLIMEGVRRLDERGRVAELLPELDVVVEALVNHERVKSSLSLTPEEWRILFLVDGRRTARDICRLAGEPDELATLSVLCRLLQANLVAVGPAAPAGPAPTSLAPMLAEGEGEGTQLAQFEKPGPVAVEFSSGVRPRSIEDDTNEIVSPKAVAYLAQARHLTISRLVLLQGEQETSYPLTKDAYTLGRHRNNDIVVGDPKVSSFHARLDRTAEGFLLVDLSSRNGTYVNSKRIINQLLQTGDEIRLGTARLVYKVDYSSAS